MERSSIKECLAALPLLVFLIVSGAGCTDGKNDGIVGPNAVYWAGLYDWSDISVWDDPGNWPDDKLRSFAYSGIAAHPDFYSEDLNGGFRYYENTISIGTESDKWIELSTDTRDSAYTWSEISANNGAYYRTLESERETEKFFEFRRVYLERPTDIMLSRVHKTSYLDRSMFNRFSSSDTVGVYNIRPILGSEAQELIEYMWKTCRLVDFGRPLTRNFSESDSGFEEEIYFNYTIGGDWGICDGVVLGRAVIRVDKNSGAVTRFVEELREIDGVCYE